MATKVKLIADNAITTTQIDTSSLDSYFSGGIGVTYSSGEISIGQAIATTDSPTFADLTLTGNLNITGDLNSYNVTDLDVTDQTITLGAGQTEALSGGSGIIIDGSGASILWDENNDWWDYNKGIRLDGEGLKLSFRTSSTSSNGEIYTSDTFGSNRLIISGDNGIHNVIDGNANGVGDWSVYNDNTSTHLLYVTGSNGQVGIGTTSIDATLDVVGSINIAGQFTSTATSKSNNTYTLMVDSSAHTSNISSAGAMSVDVNSGRAFTIAGTGNVGIGTDSPAGNLHVSGGSSKFRLTDTNITDSNHNTLVAFASGQNEFSLGVSSTTGTSADITIDGANNTVGIGTSPSATLHLNAVDAQIRLQHTGNSYYQRISTDSSNNLIFGTGSNGTERMKIDSSGLVTMTTTPAQATQERVLFLDVNSTGNQGSGYLEIHSGTNSTAKTRIEQVSSGGSGLYGTYIDTNIINVGNSASAHGNINFITNEAIRMTVGAGPNAGNVGIGTTNPSSTLHLYADDPQILLDDSNTSSQSSITGQSGNILYKTSSVNRDHVFYGVNTEVARIFGDGGIAFNGDTAAANALDDYEEGTFTVTVDNLDGYSGSPSSTTFTYTKIGNKVFCEGEFNMTSSSGNVTVGDSVQFTSNSLPFTPRTLGTCIGVASVQSGAATGDNCAMGYVALASNGIYGVQIHTVNGTVTRSTKTISFKIMYETTS